MPSDQKPVSAKAALPALVTPGHAEITRSALLSTLAALLWLPQAWAIAWGIGALVQHSATTGQQVMVVALFAGIGLLRHGLNYLAGGFATKGAQIVTGTIRADLSRAITRRSPLAGGTPSAQLASLMSDKLEVIQPYLQRFQPAITRAKFVPVVFLVAMFCISWVAGVIFLIFGPLVPVFMAVIGIAAKKASEQQMQRIASMNALLLDRLNALVDIRLLDALDITLKQFETEADDLRAKTMKVLRVAFLSSTALELLSAVGIALVAVFVGLSLLGIIHFGTYGTPLSVSGGVLLLLLAPEFFQPLRDFAAAWHDRAAAQTVAAEVQTALSAPVQPLLGQGGSAAPLDGLAHISARGVQYRYGDGALKTVPDFDIEAGQNVALTGPSGAGKSTTLALLAGLFAPEAGEIRVAGRPLDDDSADGWRARIAWVSQIPHFQNGSLRANVAPDNPADTEGILAALEKVHALDIVANSAKGLDMPLGETGAGVSGGEARRILLARAAYSGRDVIFADEPTADLDRDTAAKITRALLELGQQATLVVATHDADLVAQMDAEIRLGDEA